MKYQVQTSNSPELPLIEADSIEDKDNMYVFKNGETITGMVSKSFVQHVVAVDDDSK